MWCRSGATAPKAQIAAAIVFLLSPAANFITGDCIRIDGGVPNARYALADPADAGDAPTPRRHSTGFHLASLPRALQEG
jgi:citronellol/citronellal dehydrogenase